MLLWLLPARAARSLTAVVMLATLAAASAVMLAFDPGGARFQLIERMPWVASLNVHYEVGVDGLSVLFLPATALLFLGSVVASWNRVHDAPRFYYSLLLLLQCATLGVFCALDTVLFFVFWELTLVPIYFLLARWGVTAGSARAAARYFLIMLAGGVPLLLAFVLLAASQSVPTFDLLALLAVPLPRSTQYAVFLLCLAGFGVKVPLVPLHTWLPQFALAAPGSLTALLVGLKLGAYGLVRFAIPLAPDAAQDLHWLLAGLGTLTLIYGAVGILAQTNLRVGLAYASVCHVGLAVLGLAAFTAQGVQGAVVAATEFLGRHRRRLPAPRVPAPAYRIDRHPQPRRRGEDDAAAGQRLPGLRPGRGRHARHQQLPRRIHADPRRAAEPYRRRHGGIVRAGYRRRRLSVPLPQGVFRPGDPPRGARSRRPAAQGMGGAGHPDRPDRRHRHLSGAMAGNRPARGRGLGGSSGTVRHRLRRWQARADDGTGKLNLVRSCSLVVLAALLGPGPDGYTDIRQYGATS